jgi:phosphoserine phosphatase
MNNSNNALSFFDFDKTLIKGDSFRIFSLLASDKARQKALVLFFALCHKLKLISNSFYKESVLRAIWIDKNSREKELFLRKFHGVLRKIENKQVVNALKGHLDSGDKVVVISASPLFYLESYVKLLSENIEVIGSKFRQAGRKIEFLNMYGRKKVLCAKAIIEKINPRTIWVYTDHVSDLPLIRLADKVRIIKPSSQLIRKLNQLRIEFEIYS